MIGLFKPSKSVNLCNLFPIAAGSLKEDPAAEGGQSPAGSLPGDPAGTKVLCIMIIPGMIVLPRQSITLACAGILTLAELPSIVIIPRMIVSVWLAFDGPPVPSTIFACVNASVSDCTLIYLLTGSLDWAKAAGAMSSTNSAKKIPFFMVLFYLAPLPACVLITRVICQRSPVCFQITIKRLGSDT